MTQTAKQGYLIPSRAAGNRQPTVPARDQVATYSRDHSVHRARYRVGNADYALATYLQVASSRASAVSDREIDLFV